MPVKVRRGGVWVNAGAATGTAPTVPLSVNAVSTIASQIDLTWAAPSSAGSSPVTGYVAQATRVSTGTISTLFPLASARTASFTGLNAGSVYSVQIQAVNAAGAGPKSTPLLVSAATGTGSGSGSSGTNAGENGLSFPGYRGPSNTGFTAVFDSGLGRNVALSDLTAYAGSNTFTSDTTLFRQVITGKLTANGCTVTLNQCRAQGNAGGSGKTSNYHFNGTGNFIVTDSECDGVGLTGGDVAPYPSGYAYEGIANNGGTWVSTRCNIHGYVDGIKRSNGSAQKFDWIHGNIRYYTAAGTATHSDRVQFATGSSNDATIQYCTTGTPKSIALIAGGDRNGDGGAAWSQYETMINGGLIQLGGNFNAGATVTNLNLLSNYFNDGNYGLNGGPGQAASCSGLVSGNRAGPHLRYGPMNGSFGAAALDGTRFVFDGTNVIDADGVVYWDNSGVNNGTAGITVTAGTVWA